MYKGRADTAFYKWDIKMNNKQSTFLLPLYKHWIHVITCLFSMFSLLASCRVVFITPNPFYWDMALTTHFIRFISKTLGRTWGQFFVYYASSEVADKLRDNQTNRTHIMTPWDFTYWYNKHSTTYIVLNIYINSIVVLTVVLTPQSITTTTINSTLSSLSLFSFHPQQYNSHHFLSIFLIFKIIKTSFYTIIY